MGLGAVRRRVAGTVRTLVIGEASPPPEPVWDPNDPGLIPADSPVRIVHADAAMFIGGVRALLLQTLHPHAMYAVASHSDYEHDPLGRLHRTAAFLGATTFGSAEEGRHAVEMVRSIHSRVHGVMPDNTHYRADDPHLLGWVHATEVDSFLVGFKRFGSTRLSDTQLDRYVADMAAIGEALGVENAPRCQAELAAVIDSYRDELRPSRECRDATRFLFAPPLPIAALPFYGLIFSAATATLAPWARSMLLLPIAPGLDPLVLRPAATALTKTLQWALTGDAPSPLNATISD